MFVSAEEEESDVAALLQMLVVVVCRRGRIESLPDNACTPPRRGRDGGSDARSSCPIYESPMGEGGASLILFESAFCHVLYRSTNKTQVLD